MEITAQNEKETTKIAVLLAKAVVGKPPQTGGAVVVGLTGELGSGKTTFVRGFAEALEVKEMVKSPTFLLIKKYNLPKKLRNFKRLFHIDAYRLESEEDLKVLGFKKILDDKENIVFVEWADKIKRLLPKETLLIQFDYLEKDKRKIKIPSRAKPPLSPPSTKW